jgi:hypothetical protein
MTKNELNARLPIPLSASALKKISLADLQARVGTNQVLDDSEYLTPTRKPRSAEGILIQPSDVQKTPKPGSKRALILDMLRSGTTLDEIATATGWSRSVASSALYVDVKGAGWGVERVDGRLFLLPRGGK